MPGKTDRERGAAVLVTLLLVLLIGAIVAALVTIATSDRLISANFRQVHEAAYGAEAALERGLHDLATLADWSLALVEPPGNSRSTFHDGEVAPRAPDGRVLDLEQLTLERQAESDERDGPSVFGDDSPEWRLFAHAPLQALHAGPGLEPPLYLLVWLADDESDGDGNPAVDANGEILVWATALGPRGARRSVAARVARTSGGDLLLKTRREVRAGY